MYPPSLETYRNVGVRRLSISYFLLFGSLSSFTLSGAGFGLGGIGGLGLGLSFPDMATSSLALNSLVFMILESKRYMKLRQNRCYPRANSVQRGVLLTLSSSSRGFHFRIQHNTRTVAVLCIPREKCLGRFR